MKGVQKMTKTELIANVSAATDIPQKAVEKALNAILATISDSLAAGESVAIPGFGTFIRSHRAARTGRNPQTGEPLNVPASDVPVFKAGKTLKDAVKGS